MATPLTADEQRDSIARELSLVLDEHLARFGLVAAERRAVAIISVGILATTVLRCQAEKVFPDDPDQAQHYAMVLAEYFAVALLHSLQKPCEPPD